MRADFDFGQMEDRKRLAKALSKLDPRVALKIYGQAVRAAAAEFRKPIRRAAAKRAVEGDLKRAVTVKAFSRRMLAKGWLGVTVGFRYRKDEGSQSPGVYARFVDEGTRHAKATRFASEVADDPSVHAKASAAFTAKLRAAFKRYT